VLTSISAVGENIARIIGQCGRAFTAVVHASYVPRVLRLTLLAPDIVEAILDGRQPEGMTLPGLMGPCPTAWAELRPDAFSPWPAAADFRSDGDQANSGCW
jgi:hypothetical protein